MDAEGMAATRARKSDTSTFTRLRGKWLWVARALWLVLTITGSGLYAASIPARIRHLQILCSEAPCSPSQVSAEGAEVLESAGISLDVYALIWAIPEGLTLLVYLPVAILIFWRRSDDWMALFVSQTLLLYGMIGLPPIDSLVRMGSSQFIEIVVKFLFAVSEISVVLLLFLFPDGRFVPRWTRWLAPFYVVFSFYNGFTRESAFGLTSALLPLVVGLLVGAAAQIYRYRRLSGPTERQQTKWAVLGFAIYVGGIFLITTPMLLFPAIDATKVITRPSQLIYLIAVLPVLYAVSYVLPVFVAISVLRHRLWDVDPLINRSLVYGALTVVLAIVFAGGFFALRALLELVFGREQVVIAAAIAGGVIVGLFAPARRRLQALVDQRLYGIQIEYEGPRRRAQSVHQRESTSIGGYTGLEPIGSGGMAEVYRAVHPTLNTSVAIKVLPRKLAQEEEFRRRFEREAKVVAGLKHPNIVQMHDFGVDDGTYYMVMEYIDGVTLGQMIGEKGKLPYDQACAILTDIAGALDYAHAQGLVHRDIKPGNVMVENGRAVLMDFGIARIVTGGTRLTATGMVGTMDYIAPEQIQASSHVDGRADIYSLGVMAYQMLTWRLPFEASHPAGVLIAHLNQPPPDPRGVVPNIPERAVEAIGRAMAKKPAERFATAGEFAAAM